LAVRAGYADKRSAFTTLAGLAHPEHPLTQAPENATAPEPTEADPDAT